MAGIVDSPVMNWRTSRRTIRLWSLALCAFYIVLLVPGSFLAYIGVEWVDAAERGWRTQIAAAALVAAWFALGVGAAFSWKASRAGSGVSLLSAAAFVPIAMIFYAVTLAWGGRMLI